MNEEETNQEPKGATDDTSERSNQEIPEILQQANKTREELDLVLEEIRKENERLENNIATAQLGGKSFIGDKEKKEEETPKDYADKVLQGKL